MKRPGIVRECDHPGRPHSHGRECYRHDKCRCALGRRYYANKEAARRKRVALGLHQSAFADATGARRRLQALMTLGYTATQLGREADVSRYVIHDIMETTRPIQRGKLALIAETYDRLWDKPAPASQGQRYVANLAAKRGYAPPMAWDDDTIDAPDARPNLGSDADVVDMQLVQRVIDQRVDPSALSQLEKHAAARVLIAQGYGTNVLCKRLSVRGTRAAQWVKEAKEAA